MPRVSLEDIPIEILHRIIRCTPNTATTINTLLAVSRTMSSLCSTLPIVALAIPRYSPTCKHAGCRERARVRVRIDRRESYCPVHVPSDPQYSLCGPIIGKLQHRRTLRKLIADGNLRVLQRFRNQIRVRFTVQELHCAAANTKQNTLRYILQEAPELETRLPELLVTCMFDQNLSASEMLIKRCHVQIRLSNITDPSWCHQLVDYQLKVGLIEDLTVPLTVLMRFWNLLDRLPHTVNDGFLDLFVHSQKNRFIDYHARAAWDGFISRGAQPSPACFRLMLMNGFHSQFIFHALQKATRCPQFPEYVSEIACYILANDASRLLTDFIPMWNLVHGPKGHIKLLELAIQHDNRCCLIYFNNVSPPLYCDDPFILPANFDIRAQKPYLLARLLKFGVYVAKPCVLFAYIWEQDCDILFKGILTSPYYAVPFLNLNFEIPKRRKRIMEIFHRAMFF